MEEKFRSTWGVEKILDNITPAQRKNIIHRLDSSGFKVVSLGHISRIEIKCSEENFRGVGFLGYHFESEDGELYCNPLSSLSYLEIVPSVYSSKLREICNSL